MTGKCGKNPVSYSVTIESPNYSHPDLPLHLIATKYQIKDLEIGDGMYIMLVTSNQDKTFEDFKGIVRNRRWTQCNGQWNKDKKDKLKNNVQNTIHKD